MLVLTIFSKLVNCLNQSQDIKDPRDFGWQEHEGKFIHGLFMRDVKLKMDDNCAETREDDEDDIWNSIVITVKTINGCKLFLRHTFSHRHMTSFELLEDVYPTSQHHGDVL